VQRLHKEFFSDLDPAVFCVGLALTSGAKARSLQKVLIAGLKPCAAQKQEPIPALSLKCATRDGAPLLDLHFQDAFSSVGCG